MFLRLVFFALLAGAVMTDAAEGSWEARLVLAKWHILEADGSAAEKNLWKLFEEEHTSPQSDAASELADRYFQISALRESAEEFLAAKPDALSPRLSLATLDEGRDLALCYLSLLAADTKREVAFLAQLTEHLCGASHAERIFAYSVVENLEGLLRSIEAYRTSGERHRSLDTFCAERLREVRTLTLLPTEFAAEAKALHEAFAVRQGGESPAQPALPSQVVAEGGDASRHLAPSPGQQARGERRHPRRERAIAEAHAVGAQHGESERRPGLISQSSVTHPPEDAVEQIELLLFPHIEAPLLFAFRESAKTLRNGALADFTLLKNARRLGGLATVRARAEAAVAIMPSAKTTLLFLRALQRDAEVLPELASYARSTPADARLLPMAHELARWPEAGTTCLEILRALDQVVDEAAWERRLQIARTAARAEGREQAAFALQKARRALRVSEAEEAARGWREAAELSLLLEEPDGVQESLRGLLDRNASPMARRADRVEGAKLLGVLAGARLREDWQTLADALRNAPEFQNDPLLRRHFAISRAELELHDGMVESSAPLAWIDPDRSDEAKVTLVWDAGCMRLESGLTSLVSMAQDYPKLDGKFVVEILFGETKEALRLLAREPAAGARGTWRGALPASCGFLRVLLVHRGGVLFSEPLEISTGRNLLADFVGADTRWGFAEDWLRESGGPMPGGNYLRIEEDLDQARQVSSPRETAAYRVPIEPGKDYVLSGWIRSAGWLRLGRRFLDGRGNVLGTSYFSTAEVSDDRCWTWCRQIFTAAPFEGKGGEHIPENAAAIEPVIELGHKASAVAAMSLVSMETRSRRTAPPAEKDEPQVVLRIVPPGAGNSVSTVSWEIRPALSNASEFDGRYQLELFRGQTAQAMQRVATIESAAARGVWRSQEPLEHGLVRAVLREKDTVHISEPQLLPAGANADAE